MKIQNIYHLLQAALLLLLLKLLQLKNRKLNQLNNFTVILIRYRKGCSAKSGLFI